MSLHPDQAEKHLRQNVAHLRRLRLLSPPKRRVSMLKRKIDALRRMTGFEPYHEHRAYWSHTQARAFEEMNGRITVRRACTVLVFIAALAAMSSLFSGCGGRGEVECSIEAKPAYDGEAWPYVCIKGKWIFAGTPPAEGEG